MPERLIWVDSQDLEWEDDTDLEWEDDTGGFIVAQAMWPTTLPDKFSIRQYRESPPNNSIRQTMDVGPAKVRRRQTSAERPITGTMVMTFDQKNAFDDFYENDLFSGSLTFDGLNHPTTGADTVWRFISVPTYTNIGSQAFLVTLPLGAQP